MVSLRGLLFSLELFLCLGSLLATYRDDRIVDEERINKFCHCHLWLDKKVLSSHTRLLSLMPIGINSDGNHTVYMDCDEAAVRCRSECERLLAQHGGSGSLYPTTNGTLIASVCPLIGERLLEMAARDQDSDIDEILLEDVVGPVDTVIEQPVWLGYQATGCRHIGLLSFLGTMCCSVAMSAVSGDPVLILKGHVCPIDDC